MSQQSIHAAASSYQWSRSPRVSARRARTRHSSTFRQHSSVSMGNLPPHGSARRRGDGGSPGTHTYKHAEVSGKRGPVEKVPSVPVGRSPLHLGNSALPHAMFPSGVLAPIPASHQRHAEKNVAWGRTFEAWMRFHIRGVGAVAAASCRRPNPVNQRPGGFHRTAGAAMGAAACGTRTL